MAVIFFPDIMNGTNTTVSPSNFSSTTYFTTTKSPELPYPVYVGYIAAVVAVLMYGSNFVPIKKFYTGDGMFFQWILCCGIFMVGVVIQLIRQSTFYPFVMLGGVIWTTGNLCVVPIFKTIGMGLGMCTWSTFGLIMGWACGRFGLFGTNADVITNSGMNYGGVALALSSIVLYVMVKNEVSGSTNMEIIVQSDESAPLINQINRTGSINENGNALLSSADRNSILVFNRSNNSGNMKSPSSLTSSTTETDDRMYIETLSPVYKRIIGTALSIFSGILYGVQFTPSIYIQENKDKYKGASTEGLDYVFAQFTGIYATSCVYFFIYCAIKRNKPKVYPETILPGIISGVMWGIATSCWFLANSELSESVSYPIIGTAPAAIASLFWGLFVFHEIKGWRNILILLAAFCVMTAGVILAGLSK